MEIQPYTLLDLTYPERNQKIYFHIITLVVILARRKLRIPDIYKYPGIFINIPGYLRSRAVLRTIEGPLRIPAAATTECIRQFGTIFLKI